MKKIFQHSRRGSALLIGLIITVLLSVLITAFIEKALRTGVSVKGIEQSTQAYYYATSLIEAQLQTATELKKKPWSISGTTKGGGYSGAILTIENLSNTIPKVWLGNSPFDKNFNLISINNPVQLVIGDIGTLSTDTKILFRIPKIKQNPVSPFAGTNGNIYFSFGNKDKVFYIKDLIGKNPNEIKSSDISDGENLLNNRDWFTYISDRRQNKKFGDFHRNIMRSNECNNYACTLKFSLIKPVKTASSPAQEFPFLEYKIEFPRGNDVPLEFMTLTSQGWVGKFTRTREVDIPQITTNSALDFAVLQ